MRVVQLAIAFAFALTVSVAAQPVLKPISVTLSTVNATFAEILDLIARTAGIEIQLDDTVSEEVRNQNVPHVVFKNARLEDAIRFLSDHGKVSYEVVDESTVRVFVKR